MFYSCDSKCAVYSASEVSINSNKAVCFIGHGGENIAPYMGIPENQEITVKAVRLMLGHYISSVMNAGYTTLISGLAKGSDLLAAEYVLKRKRQKLSRLIGVMPFPQHSKGMKSESLESLMNIELHADLLITINACCPTAEKATELYHDRNCYMVDNSAASIVFFDEGNYSSDTEQIVRYAEQKNKPVYTFGVNDVYSVMERAGTDEKAIRAEIESIRLKVPKPDK